MFKTQQTDEVFKTTIYEAFFLYLGDEGPDGPYTNAKLENRISMPHITTTFRPLEPSINLYGKTGIFELYEYGCDLANEGFKVRYFKDRSYFNPNTRIIEFNDDEDVAKLFESIDIPHVTMSVSADGEPKNTKNLDFRPCPPYIYKATFGAMECWTRQDGTQNIVYNFGGLE